MTTVPALSRSTVDRAGACRTDEEWLARAWADPASRVLVLDGDRAPVVEGPLGARLAFVAPEQAPPGDRLLLGIEDGRAYWAVAGPLPGSIGSDPAVPRPDPAVAGPLPGSIGSDPAVPRPDPAVAGPLPAMAGALAADLREVGGLLDDRDAGLFVHAVALANWHHSHPRCSRCGAPTKAVSAGAVRRCDADGSEHFPRSDPAIIVLVHDGADRCVLARQASWPPRRFSILAGFVEPGESAEQALAREVAEEVGLTVTDVAYVASQPWPFPASLMLGFTARAVDAPAEGDLVADPEELAEARWFTRAEIAAAAAAGDAGTATLRLPPPVSIAWRILTDWLG